jgi:probable addiction module antidote protein
MSKTINVATLSEFDIASQLRDEADIAGYLSMVIEDGDSDELIRAIGHVAKARGMTQIANDTGLGRESLYKALSAGSKPRFDTILRVLRALNIDLKAVKREVAPQ